MATGHRVAAVAIAVVSVVGVGCGGVGGTAASSPSTTAPSPRTTTAHEAVPTTALGADATAELRPGETYIATHDDAWPGITFVMPPADLPWYGFSRGDGAFQIRQASTPREGDEVGFLEIVHVTLTAPDAVDALRAQPGLRHVGQSQRQVGGRPGTVLDVAVDTRTSVPLLLGYTFAPGETARIVVVDLDDRSVVFAAAAMPGSEMFLALSDRVLDSIAFESSPGVG